MHSGFKLQLGKVHRQPLQEDIPELLETYHRNRYLLTQYRDPGSPSASREGSGHRLPSQRRGCGCSFGSGAHVMFFDHLVVLWIRDDRPKYLATAAARGEVQ
jgi:hypothetical protein